MKRGIIVAALVAGVLALGAAPASAEETDCSSFAHTQTYQNWGPSAYYGQTVTVAFTAAECAAGHEGVAFAFELSGTAAIYAGEEIAGEPLDVLPFESSGVFTDLDGSGWPPDWWSCGVEAAQITWEIAGVYSFVATATGGVWTLDVHVPGAAPVLWQHAACA